MNLSWVCICACDAVDEVCYLQNPSSQILECVFFLMCTLETFIPTRNTSLFTENFFF